jgi:hypothetical protein
MLFARPTPLLFEQWLQAPGATSVPTPAALQPGGSGAAPDLDALVPAPTPVPALIPGSGSGLGSLGRLPPPGSLSERMLRDAGLEPGAGAVLALQMAQQASCSDYQVAREQLERHSVKLPKLLQALVGFPDALLHTARTSFEGGWARLITAVVALLCGAALLIGAGVVHPIAFLLLLPLAGTLAAWVLLLPVRLATVLFGWALAAAELLVLLAVAVPPVLWMLQAGFKVAEAAAVDRALEAKAKAREADR